MNYMPKLTLNQAAMDVLLKHTGGNEGIAALLWTVYQRQPIQLDYELRQAVFIALGVPVETRDTDGWEGTPAGNTGRAVVLANEAIFAWGTEAYPADARRDGLNACLPRTYDTPQEG